MLPLRPRTILPLLAAAALAAVAALAPLGVRATELPATPARIVGWIEAAGGA